MPGIIGNPLSLTKPRLTLQSLVHLVLERDQSCVNDVLSQDRFSSATIVCAYEFMVVVLTHVLSSDDVFLGRVDNVVRI